MKKNMLASLKDARGITLVESAIVLAIVAFVVAAVWIVAAAVNENARQNKAAQQLQQIAQNVRQLYMRVNTPNTGDRTTVLDNQQAFPLEMRITRNTPGSGLHHPWASTNTVQVIVQSATVFRVRFTNLARRACINLAVKLSGGDISGLTQMRIGTTDFIGGALPINTVNAAGSCTSANNNSLEWWLNIRG